MRPHARFAPIASMFLAPIASSALAGPPESGRVVEEYLAHPLGVVDHLNYEGVAALESHWMRMPVAWRYIEPDDGIYNYESGLNSWLIGAEAAGINGSIVVSCNQFWATGHAEARDWPSHPPLDLTTQWNPVTAYSPSYYEFISNLVTAYRGRIDRITIENEVNTRFFWAGTSDDYRRLVATAAKAVEDFAPEILVFDSGVGSGSWGVAVAEWMTESGTVPRAEILEFFNDYYAYDVYAPLHFDTYDEMAYWIRQPFVKENNKLVDSVLGAVAPHLDGLNFKFTNSSWVLPTLVEWIDRRLALHGYSLPRKVNNEASNWPRSSRADEARNLFRMVVEGLAAGVEQTIWFPYSDELANTARLGLLDENGNVTPQGDAFATLGSFVGAAYAFQSRDVLGAGVQRFRFTDAAEVGGPPVLDVMWWDDGGHGGGSEGVTFQLPPNTESIVRVEYTGGSAEIPVEEETYTSLISRDPRMFFYTFAEVGVEPIAPPVPVLSQNVPNPFRTSTTVELSIPEAMDGEAVSMRVFDASGRVVRTLHDGPLPAGTRSFVWDGRDDRGTEKPAGSYWYRGTTREGTTSKRMLLIR